MASSSRNTSGRSPLSLKFVVIGGGIAGDYLYSMGRRQACDFLKIIYVQGLAAAFTLQRAGHSVIVLEKGDEKAMVCKISLVISLCLYPP